MANVAVTNTFTAGTTAVASQVNTNFTDLVNYINNRNGGSATWDAVSISHTTNVPLICNNSTGTQNIANFQDNGTNVFSITDTAITCIINSTGMGVGTSSPTDTLHVAGNIIIVHAGLGIELQRSTYDTWRFGQIGNGLSIRNSSDARTDILIDGTGLVGIQNTSPAASLDVKSIGTTPTLILDNGSVANSILVCKDNGSNVFLIDDNGNIGMNSTNYGSGTGVVAIGNASAVPSANPPSGGILYVQSGALKYRGSSGTITTIANA